MFNLTEPPGAVLTINPSALINISLPKDKFPDRFTPATVKSLSISTLSVDIFVTYKFPHLSAPEPMSKVREVLGIKLPLKDEFPNTIKFSDKLRLRAKIVLKTISLNEWFFLSVPSLYSQSEVGTCERLLIFMETYPKPLEFISTISVWFNIMFGAKQFVEFEKLKE